MAHIIIQFGEHDTQNKTVCGLEVYRDDAILFINIKIVELIFIMKMILEDWNTLFDYRYIMQI